MANVTLTLLNEFNVSYNTKLFFLKNFNRLYYGGLDIYNIEVIGDYKGYFEWVKNILHHYTVNIIIKVT